MAGVASHLSPEVLTRMFDLAGVKSGMPSEPYHDEKKEELPPTDSLHVEQDLKQATGWYPTPTKWTVVGTVVICNATSAAPRNVQLLSKDHPRSGVFGLGRLVGQMSDGSALLSVSLLRLFLHSSLAPPRTAAGGKALLLNIRRTYSDDFLHRWIATIGPLFVTGCRVCGIYSSKRCLRCKVARYCGTAHQVEDHALHKKCCKSSNIHPSLVDSYVAPWPAVPSS